MTDSSVPALKTQALLDECWKLWEPPPKTSVSDWVSDNIVLPESAAASGQYCDMRKTPWGIEPLDAMADRRVRRIVMMWAVQLAKTQITLNAAGWRIRHDPVPILYCQPAIEDCEEFSKERLAPMLEDSPELAKLVVPDKSRSSSSTIKLKTFRGGWFGLVGMNSPRGMRRRSAGVVICDEVEEYPVNVGGGKNGPKQGDPVGIIEKRMRTFSRRNPKMYVLSTPTIKGESVIEREYLASTMERWCVPCPSCGEYQPYEFDRLVFPRDKDGVRLHNTEKLSAEEIQSLTKVTYQQRAYRDTKPAKLLESLRVPVPEMACCKCGCLHTEWEWKAGEGKWIAQRPDRFTRNGITRGFHMNSMASHSVSWQELQEHFYKALNEGPESIQAFVNTELAELWESAGESIDEELLAARRHYYDCDVPNGVAFITAGVDVQQDRLEVEVVGWGAGKESWGIEYLMLPGDPHRTQVWNELDELLQRNYVRSDGALLPISCCAVDSGYATSSVYAFTKKRAARYVFAVKGDGGHGKPVVGPWRRLGKNKDTAVFPVGTDASKDLLLTRILTDAEGPGYCHFPKETQNSAGRMRGYTEDYFKGLMAERRVERRQQGRVYYAWIKRHHGVRNEPLDCRVYATAALEIRNPDLSEGGKVEKPLTPTGTNPALRRGRRVINRGIQ